MLKFYLIGRILSTIIGGVSLSILFAFVLGVSAEASEKKVCGPDALSEKFVEVDEDIEIDEVRFKDNSYLRLETAVGKSPAGETIYNHILKYYDHSGSQNVRRVYFDQHQDWTLLGAFGSGNALISKGKVGDGSFIVIDRNGEIAREFVNTSVPRSNSIAGALTATNGDVVFYGHLLKTKQHDTSGVYVTRVSDSGEILWHKNFPYVFPGEKIRSAIALPDGSIAFVRIGRGMNPNQRPSNWSGAMVLDSSGNKKWHRIYKNYYEAEVSDLVLAGNSELVFAGLVQLNGDIEADYHLWMLKTDLSGNQMEERLISGVKGWIGSFSGELSHSDNGEIQATWSVVVPGLNDYQHYECTFGFNSP